MSTRDEYVATIKDAFINFGTKAVMTALVSLSPVFAGGFVGYVAGAIVGFVIKILVNAAEMQAFFLYIDLRTSAQGREFYEAALQNKEAQKNGTELDKRIAEQDLINKFRELVKLTN